jgi:hypothetical protein
MKKFTKSIAVLLIAMGVFTSCNQNQTEELVISEESAELSNEEIKSAIETMSFKYSIKVINDDDLEITISSDEELASYGDRTKKAKIVFPIYISVDGETITINNKEEMKALVRKKKKSHRKQPFEIIFPVTISTVEGNLVLDDKEAFKAYRESLEQGIYPTIVYPISVIFEEETLIINSETELKALKTDKTSRPTFLFPVSVKTTDGDLEISDAISLKTYRETLEEGTYTEFVFPISVIIDEEIVIVQNNDELNVLMPTKGDKSKGTKSSHIEFVFPVSVVTTDGSLEVSDAGSLKLYRETLEEGSYAEFVFPISVIIDEETIIVNNQEELKALKNKKRTRN